MLRAKSNSREQGASLHGVNDPECNDCTNARRDGLDRRGMLARLLGLVGGMLGISVLSGCPGGSTYGKKTEANSATATSSTTATGEAPPELSKLEWPSAGLPDGVAAEFKVNGKPAYLIQAVINGKKTFTAMLRRCPHSGCIVKYSYVSHNIECPCHGSQFDAEGNVLKGPARSPLTRLTVREEVGKVIVEAPGSYLGHGGVLNRHARR
jgi:Rieske Fe-S protein